MVSRLGLFALRMPDHSIFVIIDVSEPLVECVVNIGCAITRYVAVHWVKTAEIDNSSALPSVAWRCAAYACPSSTISRFITLVGQSWKRRRGGRAMTWRRDMMKLAPVLATIGGSCLPGWGPREEECCWLETSGDMDNNQNQWRECCIDCLWISAP